MKKIVITALMLISFTMSTYGQQRSYFDTEWQVTTQANMEYYRESWKQNDQILVKDYYKNGVLQMEGTVSDATPGSEVFNGKVTWYFPNGKPQSIVNFKEGEIVGELKSFDEKGRLTEDFVYGENGEISGTSKLFRDLELGNTYNSISETKNGDLVYSKVFKSNDNPLGYEIVYKDNIAVETKFFNEKGKLIGTKKIDKDWKITGIDVGYDYSDFHINRIDYYDKKGEMYRYESFYSNGMKAQEYLKKGKEATKTTYDKNAKVIGKLISKFDEDNGYTRDYKGEDISLSIEDMSIESITKYNDYKTESIENFDDQGHLKDRSTYEDDVQKEVVYYNSDGSVKSRLIYQDGSPYNGELFSDSVQSIYKEGVMLEAKSINSDTGTLLYETRFDPILKVYNTKVYDEQSQLQYVYKKFETDSYGFSAEVIQYKKGKQLSKAVINDNFLVDGKIRFKDYQGDVEQEVKGEWLITRKFSQDNVMYMELKERIKLASDEYYRPSSYIYEENLLNSY